MMDVDDLSDCASEPQGLALATDSSHEGDIAASGVVVAEDGDLSSGAEDEPMVLGSAPTTGLVLADDDDDADRNTRAEAESTAVWACPGDSESV